MRPVRSKALRAGVGLPLALKDSRAASDRKMIARTVKIGAAMGTFGITVLPGYLQHSLLLEAGGTNVEQRLARISLVADLS